MRSLTSFLACVAFALILTACGVKTVDKSIATYTGTIAEYRGEKKLVVAFTASWASFWKVSEEELKKLDRTRFDLCILDEAVDRAQMQKFGVDLLPTVALVESGTITKRVQNLSSIEQLKDW